MAIWNPTGAEIWHLSPVTRRFAARLGEVLGYSATNFGPDPQDAQG